MKLISSAPITSTRFKVEDCPEKQYMRCKYDGDPDELAGWYGWTDIGWQNISRISLFKELEAAYQETLKETVK